MTRLLLLSAALTLLSGANAISPVQPRNPEPTDASCTSFTPYKYAGCFGDPSLPRALPFTGPSNKNMTVETCVAFCKGNNYKYAGLEYYNECFCGESVAGPQVNETACSFPCQGDKTETCGGNDLLNVYQDTTFPTIDNTTIADYKPMGCYSEGATGRSLVYRQNQLNTSTLTVETCLFACKASGYPFAGVEFGQECYCGVVLGNGTLPLPATSCNMPCNGNKSETCGGHSTLNLYVATDLESTQPCNGGSSSSSSVVSSTTTSISSSIVPPPATTSSSSTTKPSVPSSSSSSSPVVQPPTTSSSSTPYSSPVVQPPTTSSSSTPYSSPVVQPPTTSSSSTPYSSPVVQPPTTSSSSTPYSSPVVQPPTTSSSSTPYSSPVVQPPTTSSSSTKISSSPVVQPPTTSSTPCTTSSTKVPTSSRTSPIKLTTSPIITSTMTPPSLCTTTIVSTPTPTCEYKCGSWCSKPMPTFTDNKSCLQAVSACSVQVASCFLNAGFPASLGCFEFSSWCTSISSYCGNSCLRGTCSPNDCKSKYPPAGYNAPVPTTSTSVYVCPVSTAKPSTTSAAASTTTLVPVPTNSNICVQPNNPNKGYSSQSPVGNIALPCLTCNNLKSDYNSGNCFKLYTHSETSQCPSYQRGNHQKACRDACDSQYNSCVSTYAEGCKNNKRGENYNSASQKCYNQWADCYAQNQYITVSSSRCSSYNSGWY